MLHLSREIRKADGWAPIQIDNRLSCSILILLFHYSIGSKDAETCGSTFKLVNQKSGDRLHSHDVKYGSGSGQQVGAASMSSADC